MINFMLCYFNFMRKVICLLTVTLNLWVLCLPAQNALNNRLRKIDSLKKVLNNESVDTTRVNILNSISANYKNSSDFENGVLYGNKALELAQKSSYRKGEAKAFFNIAAALKSKGDYEAALDYALKSLKIREDLGDKKNIPVNLSEIGSIYRVKGDLKKALEFQMQSLKIREELGDKIDIAASLNGIGSVHSDLGEYQKALEAFMKSAKLSVESGETKDIASTYNNIGNVYMGLRKINKSLEYYLLALKLNEQNGNLRWKAVNLNNIASIYSQQRNFPKALEYFQQSLSIKEEISDKGGIASSLNNLGICYSNTGDHKKAIQYCKRSLAIREDIGDKGGIADCLKSLGTSYGAVGENKKAIEILNQGIKLGSEIGVRHSVQLCYLNLSFIYEKLNDTKSALKYYKLASIEEDSLLNQESNKNMAKMSAQFDSVKKDNEIKLLNKDKEKQEAISLTEKKKQKIIIGSVTTGLILVMVFALFIFRSYRQKQKDNIEITLQKQIIEIKNTEVRDSITYAKRIQTAILPSDKMMKDYFTNSFVLFKPKDIVSGDFYWMERLGTKILFATVDCTGHGVPGAMVSVVGHNALNRTIKEFGLTQPAAILDKLTQLVEETFEKSESEIKDGMDISLCCLDIKSGKLDWAGANNPLWIMSKGEIKEIKADKQPIGNFILRKPFTNHSIQLQKEDCIYIFTDGFADQFGGSKGKKFKYKQIKELVLTTGGKSMEEQKDILLKTFSAWKGDLEQVDDVCFIGIKV